MTSVADEEWCVLTSLLPDGWQELARETGAMRRASGEIRSADTLLQVLLLHVATGLSLKQAATRAKVQGVAAITDVALLKRLRTSEAWLRELSKQMFERSRFLDDLSGLAGGRRLRAVDATTVQEPGATGTDWRVHYCIGLPGLDCDYYELTSVSGGETYKRLPVSPGDIVLGDRGYCHREGMAHVLEHRGDVVVRLNTGAVPLMQATDEACFDLLERLRTLSACSPAEWAVRFEAGKKLWPARLCAIRKSAEAAQIAKEKVLRDARRKGRKVKPETLEYAEYTLVITTLDREQFDSAKVLELYRARWQVELCFKRFKSLLQLGHLPKRSDASARAWIQGKLLTVLLVERLADEARFFSPWGYRLAMPQSLA
ncbi:MAG: IS4 family transposase [Wenzhouxiangella sp.]|nr:MAG: IS4 family transposase [Wenzhouxiangella sp.]